MVGLHLRQNLEKNSSLKIGIFNHKTLLEFVILKLNNFEVDYFLFLCW
jgi:hypothetical protein